jgi:hypothetical protein
VRECLAIIREVSAEQRARGRHLDLKTGTLAGFAATALTLNATLGRPLLVADLGSVGSASATAAFLLAVLAFGLAAGFAVVGGLRPMGHDDLTEEQIDAYSDRPKVITPVPDLQMTWLRTMTEMALSDRAAADAKAAWARRSTWLLAAGLVGAAGQAVTLAVST